MTDSFIIKVKGWGDRMYPKDIFKKTIWGLDFESTDVQKVKFMKYVDAKKVKVTLEVVD